MKRITITCDFCEKVLGENHIKLGSIDGGELCYENKLKDTGIGTTISIVRYADLHFCDKDHFVFYFF